MSIAEDSGTSDARLWALVAVGRALSLVSKPEAARELLNNLLLEYESGYGKSFVADAADELASVEHATGNTAQAVAVWAATSRVRKDLQIEPTPNDAARRNQEIEHAREQLGETLFANAWNLGDQIEPIKLAQFARSDTPTPA